MRLSRLYLGFHYPTDVIAGYLVTGFWTTALLGRLKPSSRAEGLRPHHVPQASLQPLPGRLVGGKAEAPARAGAAGCEAQRQDAPPGEGRMEGLRPGRFRRGGRGRSSSRFVDPPTPRGAGQARPAAVASVSRRRRDPGAVFPRPAADWPLTRQGPRWASSAPARLGAPRA